MKCLPASVALFLLPLCANAQVVAGPYISLGAGVNMPGSEVNKATTSPGFDQTEMNLNDGPALQGSVGYGLGNGFRFEVEGDYANNQVTTASLRNVPTFTFNQGGRQEQYGVLVNVIYDINLGLPVVPYFGAGIGYQAVDWNSVLVCHDKAGKCDSATGGLAYQAIGGLSLPLGFMPGLALTAEYRYLGVSNLNDTIYEGSEAGYAAYEAGTGPRPSGTINRVTNSEALIGLRYAFGDFLQ